MEKLKHLIAEYQDEATRQLIYFFDFCNHAIGYNSITIPELEHRLNSKRPVWEYYLQHEQQRYAELNESMGGLETHVPDLGSVKWEFVRHWFNRYYNAREEAKPNVFKLFAKAMQKEYFSNADEDLVEQIILKLTLNEA